MQHCACGKRDGGICRSRNVKGAAGLRLPYPTPSELNTWVGSPKYKQREVQLKALMGEQKFAANKEQLMKANSTIRVHRDHYPARNGKPHLTPSKRQPGALVLRSQASTNGPVSTPIDTDPVALEQAGLRSVAQQGATRAARRRLDEADPAASLLGQMADIGAQTADATATIAAMQREMQAMREASAEAHREMAAALEAEKRKSVGLERKVHELQTKLHTECERYKARLDKVTKLINKLRDEAKAPGDFRGLHSSMLHEGKMKQRVRNYTGFWGAAGFDAFIEYMNVDGELDAVAVMSSPWDEPPDAAAATNTPAPKLKKPRIYRRALQPKEAMFFVLFRLRTGLDIIDIHALFDIGYSTACRYFTVYVSFLAYWLEREFPMPTEAQLRACEPAAFKKEYSGRDVQMIIDAHEQECEEPSNLPLRRNMFSDYKHRTTCKFLGACTPAGACIFASTAYGGKCDDKTLTQTTGLLEQCYKDWTTLADKGFMMHAEFAEVGHNLFVPSHARVGVKTYTADESKWTNKIGKTRIHIERMFKRAQEYKIMHARVKISNMHMAGTIFKCCCFLTNFEPPLVRQEDHTHLRSLFEIQWS